MARFLLCVAAAIVVILFSPLSPGVLGEYKDYLLALLVVVLLEPLFVDHSD